MKYIKRMTNDEIVIKTDWEGAILNPRDRQGHRIDYPMLWSNLHEPNDDLNLHAPKRVIKVSVF